MKIIILEQQARERTVKTERNPAARIESRFRKIYFKNFEPLQDQQNRQKKKLSFILS